MEKKKLLLAIGPFLAAVMIIGFIVFSPINLFQKPSEKAIHRSASSMSVNVLKGNALKNEAMASGHYLPFFGSSELSRVNEFHPSVLAQKYNRDYEPYLLGAAGTQSLTHYFMLNSMKQELKGKKIVFVISPQWFVKDGVGDPMFSLFYSPLQTNQWLMDVDPKDENSQYLASRLKKFSSVKSDTQLNGAVKKIAKGEEISNLDYTRAMARYRMLSKEDLLFSKIGVKSKFKKIDREAEKLPANYSFEELDKLAFASGKKETNNNEFEVANGFYSKRILPVKGKMKNSQTKFDYVVSPEFSDFQLLLNEMAKNEMDVLFVIPPVNKKWSTYTGLSQEMLDTFSKKMTYQLNSQGFNHVVDYTNKHSEPYFMEDTIHIGWRGWLELDKDLQKFLQDSNKPSYDIKSDEFLSKEWQNRREF